MCGRLVRGPRPDGTTQPGNDLGAELPDILVDDGVDAHALLHVLGVGVPLAASAGDVLLPVPGHILLAEELVGGGITRHFAIRESLGDIAGSRVVLHLLGNEELINAY